MRRTNNANGDASLVCVFIRGVSEPRATFPNYIHISIRIASLFNVNKFKAIQSTSIHHEQYDMKNMILLFKIRIRGMTSVS